VGTKLDNCWSSSNSSAATYYYGIVLNQGPGKVEQTTINNTQMTNNKNNAIVLLSQLNTSITGCNIFMNGMSQNATYHGIAVNDGNQQFVLTSNMVGSTSDANGAPEHQAYGIFIGNNCNNYVVTGNMCRGNRTGPINYGSGGTNVVTSGNLI
jgi:Right handed beta helix region